MSIVGSWRYKNTCKTSDCDDNRFTRVRTVCGTWAMPRCRQFRQHIVRHTASEARANSEPISISQPDNIYIYIRVLQVQPTVFHRSSVKLSKWHWHECVFKSKTESLCMSADGHVDDLKKRKLHCDKFEVIIVAKHRIRTLCAHRTTTTTAKSEW